MLANDERILAMKNLRSWDKHYRTFILERDVLHDIEWSVGFAESDAKTIFGRLADLIEPEPERTCRMLWEVPAFGFYNYECSNCEEKFYFAHPAKLKFCPECGAKVIEG